MPWRTALNSRIGHYLISVVSRADIVTSELGVKLLSAVERHLRLLLSLSSCIRTYVRLAALPGVQRPTVEPHFV